MLGSEADRAGRGRRGDGVIVFLDVMHRGRGTVVFGGESSVDGGTNVLRRKKPHVSRSGLHGGWVRGRHFGRV